VRDKINLEPSPAETPTPGPAGPEPLRARS
jgi:hypothetical protein